MTFKTRIRTVRFKNGGSIRLLPPLADPGKESYKRIAPEVVDGFARPIAGYAIIVWDTGAYARVTTKTFQGCPIPRQLIPDYVRGVVMESNISEIIEEDIKAFGLIP